ncbi:MAG: hypothetical protein ACI8Y8_004300 [Planctomycetota bacterium]|jgi:hypothetical protein
MRRYASVWAVGHAATKAIVIPGAQGVGLPEGDGSLSEDRARRGLHPAGSSTMARTKRTAQKPGRPSLLLVKRPASGEPMTDLRRAACSRDAHAAGRFRWHRTSARDEVGPRVMRKGRRQPRPMGVRESEGCIRALKSGNGTVSGPGRAKAARVGVNFRKDP